MITAIGELIQISDKKAEFPDYGNRHGNKAKNGWYRYDTRFGIPVYSEVGEIERYNIFRARMLVRCDADYVALWNIVIESDMNKEYSLICLKNIRMI